MGPPQLGDDALAQLVKVDPERPKQRSSCASIAVRQPDVRNDPPVPPRLPCTAHRLASILQHPKHHVHWADLTMPERARLLAGQLQGPLGEERRATQRRPHHPPAPPTTPAGHPPGRLPDRPEAIRLLGVATNRVKVDAEGVEQLSVAGPRRGHHPPPRHTQQDMLRPEVAVAEPLGLVQGKVEDQMSLLREPLEHLALPPEPSVASFFAAIAYGTATRSSADTASCSLAAIACHDQPLARAFSTCKASSTSTSPAGPPPRPAPPLGPGCWSPPPPGSPRWRPPHP